MKRLLMILFCAGSLQLTTSCQEDIVITEVPLPPTEEEPGENPGVDIDKIYNCAHPLLLTEQAQKRVVIVDADTKELLWEWNPLTASDLPSTSWTLFNLPSEAKAVYNRKYILVTASGGGAAIIRIADKKLMFYANVGNNPHSAEVFPDGNLVVASTENEGFLTTYRVDTIARTGALVQKVPLVTAHNAVWDRTRNRLLACSNNQLCVYTYNNEGNNPRITFESSVNIPSGNWAHDLYPVHGENALWLSNGGYVMKVSGSDLSMAAASFTKADVKSVSSGPAGFPTILMTPKTGEWWNSKVMDTSGSTIFEQGSMQIYKARWFLENAYSYPAKHDFVQPAK